MDPGVCEDSCSLWAARFLASRVQDHFSRPGACVTQRPLMAGETPGVVGVLTRLVRGLPLAEPWQSVPFGTCVVGGVRPVAICPCTLSSDVRSLELYEAQGV